MTAEERRAQYLELALRYDGQKKGSNAHSVIVAAYNTIRPLPRGYTLKATDSYCAAFVSALAQMLRFDFFPMECGVYEMREKSIDFGIWRDRNTTPDPGDLIFFASSHVGIVLFADSVRVVTLEANIDGGRIGQREYAVYDSRILGYAKPDYGDAAKSDFPFTGYAVEKAYLRTSPEDLGDRNLCNIEDPEDSPIRNYLYPGEEVKIVGESGQYYMTEISGRYTWYPWVRKTDIR